VSVRAVVVLAALLLAVALAFAFGLALGFAAAGLAARALDFDFGDFVAVMVGSLTIRWLVATRGPCSGGRDQLVGRESMRRSET